MYSINIINIMTQQKSMKSLYDQISSPYNRAKTMLPKLTSKSAAESSRQMNHRYCGGRSCRCLYDVKRLRCKMAKLDHTVMIHLKNTTINSYTVIPLNRNDIFFIPYIKHTSCVGPSASVGNIHQYLLEG